MELSPKDNQYIWVSRQKPIIKDVFFKKFSHFLNNSELKSVISQVSSGVDIADAHRREGLFAKYHLDFFRIKYWVEENYPGEVID